MLPAPPPYVFLPQDEASRPRPGALELEGQIASFGRNEAAIPGDDGTRFNLRRLVGSGAFGTGRVTLTYEREENGPGFRFLYAPLRRTGRGTLSENVSFDGGTFVGGVPIDGTYQFNSYRFTYRNRWKKSPRSDYRLGVTLKIRDAEIALEQGGVRRSYTDLGVVPLFHAYFEERLGPRTLFNLDFDGAIAAQGRAIDVGLRFVYESDRRTRWFVGYRALDGGVDNPKVYNFAFVSYALAGVQFRF